MYIRFRNEYIYKPGATKLRHIQIAFPFQMQNT